MRYQECNYEISLSSILSKYRPKLWIEISPWALIQNTGVAIAVILNSDNFRIASGQHHNSLLCCADNRCRRRGWSRSLLPCNLAILQILATVQQQPVLLQLQDVPRPRHCKLRLWSDGSRFYGFWSLQKAEWRRWRLKLHFIVTYVRLVISFVI